MSDLNSELASMQKRLKVVEAYRIVGEFINNTLPSNKILLKMVENDGDILLEIAQHLALQCQSMAHAHLTNATMSLVLPFSNDEIAILRSVIDTVKSKKS